MGEPSKAPKGPQIRWQSGWIAASVAVVVGVLYISLGAFFKPEADHRRGPSGESWTPAANSGGAVAAESQGAGPELHVIPPLTPPSASPAAPDAAFVDASGKSVQLKDFRGKVVLVNFWATWCGPCRVEMPALAKLQAAYSGRDVVVLPISIDSPRASDKAKAFIAANAPLSFHQDPTYSLPPAMTPPVVGVPASFLLDRQGRVRARIDGDADWTGANAKDRLDHLLAE